MNKLAFLLCLALFSFLAAAASVDSCQSLSNPGETYTLSKDVFWNGTYGECFNVSADGITLDCQGHWINGTGETYTYGVYNEGFDGVTITNCKIASLDHAIYWYMGADNGTISDNTFVSNNYAGLALEFNCTNNQITDNTASDNGVGISLAYNCENNLISGNTVQDSGDSCVYVSYLSHNNTIENQQCTNNFFGVYLDDHSNDNTVLNNIIQGGTAGVIIHSESNNNEVGGNTISGTERGIYVEYYSNDNKIASNVVTDSSWWDVSLDSSTSGNTGANTCQLLEDLGANSITCSGSAVPTPTPAIGGATPTNGNGGNGSTSLCCLPAFLLLIPLCFLLFTKN